MTPVARVIKVDDNAKLKISNNAIDAGGLVLQCSVNSPVIVLIFNVQSAGPTVLPVVHSWQLDVTNLELRC